MTDTFEDVKVAQVDGDMLTIDWSDGRNSLGPDRVRKICSAIDQMTHDFDERVIAVTGAGKYFPTDAGFTFAHLLIPVFMIVICAQICRVFEECARLGTIIAKVMDETGVSGDTIVEQEFRVPRAFRTYDGLLEAHK